MATPPTNSQNASALDVGKAVEESLRIKKKLEGDYNNELSKSISLLTKINELRDSSIAKVKSLNKETINTKEIQKELNRAKFQTELADIKIKNLSKDMSDIEKQAAKDFLQLTLDSSNKQKQIQKDIARASLENDDNKVKALNDELDLIATVIEEQEKLLSVRELSLASAIQAKNVSEETKSALEEELELEKKIEKNIGLSGRAMGLFANKLGIGTEYYAEMVEKSKDLEKVGKKLTFFDKVGGLAKTAGAGIFEAISDPLTAIPIAGAAIGGLVKGLKSAFDFIVGIQDQTIKFARAMNMSTEDARQLKMQFADINVANGDLFVNTQKLVEAQTEMVGLLGVTNVMSAQNLATNIKLKDIAGVEAETIGSITEASIINGKSNESIVKSVFAQVKGLKQATGIQFENKQILKEASSLGGVLGLQFAKYPAQLTKSLLTVKAMGLELKQVDALADSFLDFESSISKEFEAQLLTGKQINLEKAREMFLNNDLAGAAAEINKQVGSSAEFMAMNRIQQEAFAGAMGMSRDQMGDMLKQQEMLSKLGAKDTDNAREQLRLGLAKYENQKALSEAIGEENYQNLVNASLQEKIAAFIDKIKQSVMDFVEKSGIIEKIEGFMERLSNPENIRKAIMTVRDVFADIVDIVATIASGIVNVLDFVGAISDEKADSISEFLDGAGDRVRSMGGNLSMAAANNAVAGTSTKTETAAAAAPQPYQKRMGESLNVYNNNVLTIDGEVAHRSVQKAAARDVGVDGQAGQGKTGQTKTS